MTTTKRELELLSSEALANVTGGFDIGGLIGSIGGLVDKFAGTNGKASQIAGSISNLVSSFKGGGAAPAAE